MHHNYKWLLLHDDVLRVISVERGMLRSVFFFQKPVPPTLSVGDFPGVRSSRRRTETLITRAGHRAEEGRRREDRGGRRKRRTEERKRARDIEDNTSVPRVGLGEGVHHHHHKPEL